MATEARTLERLQYLEALYRQGYRSEVVDRSLEKLVALEKEVARRELAELQERLRVFETQYQMPSETFYQRFRPGNWAIQRIWSNGASSTKCGNRFGNALKVSQRNRCDGAAAIRG
jgi:hypothetical protein